MMFWFVGGPAEDGTSFPVPWPAETEPPPYVCTGDGEPFLHFSRNESGSEPVYFYDGECRGLPHPHGYPHTHGEDTDDDAAD